ncbi:MAG TPA: sulfatase [Candidatus Binatia bacterium]|nr:sulfatase [Candidatus Binatia bacterium]
MQRPDLILIVLDTQRADRLGCYGYAGKTTPNLDAFAKRAVLFERALSPAQWTIPSHASMFTGRYPTAHRVQQSSQSLSPDLPHVAEIMQDAGYETVGFCNNPLVGILNNGFKRGFDRFYNYGGAIPSVPKSSSPLPWPLNRVAEAYTQFLRRLSYPIQNFFGRSDLAFRLSLNACLTPLWSRFANFKGQNERSIHDAANFLRERERRHSDKPLFLFINLMETHLPFWPPGRFVEQQAPYMQDSKAARDIMRRWNREAYRWAAPLAEPLQELERRVLSDMYDAEVAYQDDYLSRLFSVLDARAASDNTLTLITADHGDGLGEHGYMGHAFVAYDELVRVPLIVHWPRRFPSGSRRSTAVSTRRVFHTLVEAAAPAPDVAARYNLSETRALSLLETVYGKDPEHGLVLSEVYPPLNFVRAIEHRQPELLSAFRCLSRRRALVQGDLKLITVDDETDELFDLQGDPQELVSLVQQRPDAVARLEPHLTRLVELIERQRDITAAGAGLEIGEDDSLLQRLRGLGYID